MAGLALGSWQIGRWIDRRGEELRIYGFLELAIGIFALFFLPAVEWTGQITTAIYRQFQPSFYVMSLVRFAFAFSLLLVPTAFMGGTLPVLVRFWIRARGEVGRSVGNLYGINTLGAMAGCLLAGFYLIATFGIEKTIHMTAAVNVALGLIAVILGFSRSRVEAGEVEIGAGAATGEVRDIEGGTTGDRAKDALRYPRSAVAALGVSGFLALAYEVVWTRVLLYVLAATVYAFTIMLATFLAGLAIGSFLLSRRVDHVRSGLRLFAILEILIGAAALFSIVLLSRFTEIHESLLSILRVNSWNMLTAVKFIESALIIFLPSLLMGMTFPLVSSICAQNLKHVGSRIGNMAAINTAGAVLGSFAAGYIMIPLLGTQTSIVVLAVGNALLGGGLFALTVRRKGLARPLAVFFPAAALLLVSIFLPKRAFLSVFGINLPGGKIVYCKEGVTGTITIHQTGSGARLLSINGADVAGTTPQLRTTQKLQAHIPLLLHPDPKLVMQVGLGSGETAHSILHHPIERLDGIDISPEVIQAGPHFDELNEAVYQDPRVRIIIEDARNYVVATTERYDLILNDSVHPLFRGSSDLYARDYFRDCRERLAEGGMMSSWFPTGMLSESDLKMLLRTFQEVFPECTVWIAKNCLTRNALLLGWKSDEPFRIDFQDVARRIEDNRAIREDLKEINLEGVYGLLDCFMLDAEAIRAYTEGARINTYDLPHMEFSAPRVTAAGDRPILVRNFQALSDRKKSIVPRLINLGPNDEIREQIRARMEIRQAASEHILRGLIRELRGEESLAQNEFSRALEVYPGDPTALSLLAGANNQIASLEAAVRSGTGDLRKIMALSKIYAQQGRYASAAELLEKVIAQKGDHAKAHLQLALAKMNLGELEFSRQLAERAFRFDARLEGPAYAIMGRGRYLEKDVEGAEAELRHSLVKGSALPWAEALLGDILRAKGELDEAVSHYRRALELNPNLTSAQQGLQQALASTGRNDGGNAVERGPEDGTKITSTGDGLEWAGDFSMSEDPEARAVPPAKEE